MIFVLCTVSVHTVWKSTIKCDQDLYGKNQHFFPSNQRFTFLKELLKS